MGTRRKRSEVLAEMIEARKRKEPAPKPPKAPRKDAVIRIRVSYSLRDSIRELAEKREVGVSRLIRHMLLKEVLKAEITDLIK